MVPFPQPTAFDVQSHLLPGHLHYSAYRKYRNWSCLMDIYEWDRRWSRAEGKWSGGDRRLFEQQKFIPQAILSMLSYIKMAQLNLTVNSINTLVKYGGFLDKLVLHKQAWQYHGTKHHLTKVCWYYYLLLSWIPSGSSICHSKILTWKPPRNKVSHKHQFKLCLP